MPSCKIGRKRDSSYLVTALSGIGKGRLAALLRRLSLDDSDQLILGGFLRVRVTVPVDRQDGIADPRHGDAIRGTVRARHADRDRFSLHVGSFLRLCRRVRDVGSTMQLTVKMF